MMHRRMLAVAGAMLLTSAGAAEAQVTGSLPMTSQQTTLTVSVSEQAKVTVPAGVTFTINDIGASTASSAQSISIENIVLATATKQIAVSLQGNAASFTPPVAGATTWAVGDVAWNAATWTNATGASGTLSNSAYNAVATCTADVSTCATTALVFTLGAKTTVRRAGNHTLVITWKVESTGT